MAFIDQEKLLSLETVMVDSDGFEHFCVLSVDVRSAPSADVAPVVHGRWELEVRSFYVDTWDESCELAVYILASCSECNEKHPNSHQIFSKRLYAPEDADDDFRFDKEVEMAKALAEFKQRGYMFANYCPNCGADMRVDEEEKLESHSKEDGE